MKKVFALCIGVLLFAACERDTLVPEIEEINVDQTTLAKKGNKVDVCHKGKIINVSVNAVSAHQGHGDAVDMDGDGYFDIENTCSAIDCDDTNPNVNPAMEEVCGDGIDNNCDGHVDEDCVTLQIGDLIEGGIVFYIAPTPIDLDGDGDLDTGLVCAIEDQGRIHWFNGSQITTGATGITIGTGSANTDAIIAEQGPVATDYAAGLARAYTGGGYNDWFLPSKDELNQMYINKATLEAVSGFVAFFITDYWSSTESSNSGAWGQDLTYPNQGRDNKFVPNNVRAVRAF